MKNEQMRNEDFAMRKTFPNNNTLQNGGKNKYQIFFLQYLVVMLWSL